MSPVSSGRLRPGEITMDQKKLIIAIALSILVMVTFQTLFPKPKPTPTPIQPVAQGINPPRGMQSTTLPIASQKTPFNEKDTVAETDRYVLTFTNKGGSIKSIQLKEYRDAVTGAPFDLVQDVDSARAVCAIKSNILIPGLEEQNFRLAEKQKDRIVYTYSMPGSFAILKEYYLHNSNDFIELRVSIQNLGNETIYKDYDILGASSIQSKSMAMGRRYLEIDSMIDGKIVKNSKVKTGEELVRGIVGWTGVKERYFCIVLKPQQESEGVILQQFGKSSLASGIRTKRTPIYAGSATEDTYVVYIGPTDIVRLKNLGLGLEQIVNYGIFGGISKFLLATLRTFHKVTNNWGVAIILLTCVINLVLFPLTRKSFQSMSKIQEVQPHIEKLRQVHKDNPQRLNKELAEVYRQYNINPLGGCLPLLLQMPIFIGLYQGLIRSIELKGANFLWIKDLSSPDFVSLPFKLPMVGNQIHILPLLMVVAMFFQQKISAKSAAGASAEQKQQQKIMLIFFPLFFGFLFYNFPAGLVLYWLTNTVLMVIEHSAMRKAKS